MQPLRSGSLHEFNCSSCRGISTSGDGPTRVLQAASRRLPTTCSRRNKPKRSGCSRLLDRRRGEDSGAAALQALRSECARCAAESRLRMYTVSDFVIDRLIEWDLHRFYGFPGDGIGGFDGALGRAEAAGKAFRYIRPTHEEMAALMACAHAKFTGEVGVCIATSGPGAVHLHERPLRRALRQPAGGRDRRAAGPGRDGQRLPAGAQHGAAVRRRRRIREDGDDADAGAVGGRPGGAHRAGVPQADRGHPAGRRAEPGDGGARPSSTSCLAYRGRPRLDADRAARSTSSAARRQCSTRAEGRDARRPRRARRHRRGARGRRAPRRGHHHRAARQGARAGRRAVPHPAARVCSARSRATT